MNPLLELRKTLFNPKGVGVGRVVDVLDNKILISTVDGNKLVGRNSLAVRKGDKISFEGDTAIAIDLIETRLQTHFL